MDNVLSLENLVHLQNPWFTNRGEAPTDKFLPKRVFYAPFKSLVAETKQISALIGMRRVGKTVILRQLLAEKLEEPKNLPLYFSFDQEIIPPLKNPLSEIINYYLTNILKRKLSQIDQTVYLFFDEIQLIPFWPDTLKRYYDLNQKLKFVVSGSSSLFLRESSKESLAGRIFEQILPPLTFGEYKTSQKGSITSETTGFEDYLRYGGFFEELELNDEARKKEFLREWVLGKVLEQDLSNLTHVRDKQIFRILFQVILGCVGQNVSLSKIATELEVSPTTITNYVSLLEQTLLLASVFNLAGSFIRRERRLRKIYPSSPNFLTFLPISPANLGPGVETYVFNYLRRIYSRGVFFFQERQRELDFLVPEKSLALEVKYQQKIHPQDYRNLRQVMKKKKYSRGVLVNKNVSSEKTFPEGTIISLPAHQLESSQI
ncbi:ATP-binding protein [Candidatus Woesebacteria bacterium]|nr:ATP-binding protein [Candidatus Woesebacteria bacterium]